MTNPPDLKLKTLITRDVIDRRVAELGREISGFYGKEPLTVIVMLNGGFIFGADLIRCLSTPVWVDSLAASSYVGHCSCGDLVFRCAPKLPIAGRHLLLVDDILDTGLTLQKVIQHFQSGEALSIRSCVLLDKQVKRAEGTIERADWTGFVVPPEYIVGYGLDSNEYFRQLPYVAAVVE